eukprot:2032648-Karenia_brevis.AAC.1
MTPGLDPCTGCSIPLSCHDFLFSSRAPSPVTFPFSCYDSLLLPLFPSLLTIPFPNIWLHV